MNSLRLWLALRALAFLLVWLLSQGCSYLKLEAEHISHPMAGYPVGPADQEDTLNQVNACLGKRARLGVRAMWYAEHCLGYKVTDGGFYGPSLTYTGRTGIEIKLGSRQ